MYASLSQKQSLIDVIKNPTRLAKIYNPKPNLEPKRTVQRKITGTNEIS